MRVVMWTILGAALISGASACGVATTAGADFTPGVEFGPYGTYAWDEDAIRRGGDVRLENNPFFEDALYGALEGELGARGINRAQADPELLVHYHLAVEDHIEVYESDPQSGYPAAEYGPGTEVVQYQQGTFVVHFVDAETGEDLWIGWAQGDIGNALESNSEMQQWVDDAVSRMFRDFPM